jgi:hypothetical protein
VGHEIRWEDEEAQIWERGRGRRYWSGIYLLRLGESSNVFSSRKATKPGKI